MESTVKYNENYDCVKYGHIMDPKWYPQNKQHLRRTCVVPGCQHTEVQKV